MVVLRLNLDQVEADQIEAAQSTHQPTRIAAARSADFGSARPGCEAGVDEIDVEREKDRTFAGPLEPLRQDVVNASLQKRLGRNQMEAERTSTASIFGPVQGPPDAEL